jgi:hypothetical protein
VVGLPCFLCFFLTSAFSPVIHNLILRAPRNRRYFRSCGYSLPAKIGPRRERACL